MRAPVGGARALHACGAGERGCLCHGTCVGSAAAAAAPRCHLALPEMKPSWQRSPAEAGGGWARSGRAPWRSDPGSRGWVCDLGGGAEAGRSPSWEENR